MTGALASLFDSRALNRIKERFSAWWDGTEPPAGADDALFEDPGENLLAPEPAPEGPAPPRIVRRRRSDPRLEALGLLWGDDRLFLGDAAGDSALYAALEMRPGDTLGVFGPGLIGPLEALAEEHPGPMRVFEWRVESTEPLKRDLAETDLGARVKLAFSDISTCKLPPETIDGFISYDEFTYADAPSRLAGQIVKALHPQGFAIVEWYAGRPGKDLAPAFAAAFAEPHVRAGGVVTQAFVHAGCAVEADDDVTAEHLDRARERMRAFAQSLHEPPAGGLAAMRELAWEAESWAARRAMLQSGRLQRRRIKVRRIVD